MTRQRFPRVTIPACVRPSSAAGLARIPQSRASSHLTVHSSFYPSVPSRASSPSFGVAPVRHLFMQPSALLAAPDIACILSCEPPLPSMAERITAARRTLLALRCACFLLPWLTHLLLADVALSALLPLSALFPDRCYHLSSRIAASVWRGIQTIFTRRNEAHITVSGAEALPPGESAIVISNHVEWTDFYMIQELAIRRGMLARCRWFAKRQLKWVPFLGWGLWAMGMPLVSRKWTTDQKEMNRVFSGVLQRRWPTWLISYSEATRFTRSKRDEAEAWCRTHDKRLGKHLLYPRTRGFVASVQKLRHAPHVQAVYDVTIAYGTEDDGLFQQPPSFAQSLLLPALSKRWRFFVHVERHALRDLPSDADALATWLEDRWVEKGERLEALRQRLECGLPWDAS